MKKEEEEVVVGRKTRNRVETKSLSMPLKSFFRQDNSVRFDRQKGRDVPRERDNQAYNSGRFLYLPDS